MAGRMNEVVEMVETSTMLPTLHRAEIEQAVATARAFPRSERNFSDRCSALIRGNVDDFADECIYAVPRGGKSIEGPSIRFAEMVGHSWGNGQVATRVVEVGSDFVTVQALFHDLETNWKVVEEVRRRITDRDGKRYNDDMIVVTTNAARSIAMRNAVLHAIPKPFWEPLYKLARDTAAGLDDKQLTTKRTATLEWLKKKGADESRIFSALGVERAADIGRDELTRLIGLANAVKDGTRIETAFPGPASETKAPARGMAAVAVKVASAVTTVEAPPEPARTVPSGSGTATAFTTGVREPVYVGDLLDSIGHAPEPDPAGPTNHAALLNAAVKALRLSPGAKNRLVLKHGGNFAAAYADLDNLANEGRLAELEVVS